MKSLRLTLLLSILVGLLAACAPEQPADTSLQVTDALGRTVSFSSAPERIVIAGKASGLLVNAFYLFPGYDDRLVGYENRMQPSNDFIPLVSPGLASKTLLEVDAAAEQIAPLKPDVVILKTYMKEKLGDPLEELSIPVVYLEMENPEQFTRDIRILGNLLDDAARAETIVKYYDGISNAITIKTTPLSAGQKPTVLLLQYSAKGGEVAFNIPPAAWLQTQMVEMAGGIPVWKDAGTGSGWQVVTVEQIAAWNADKIIIVDYKGDAPKAVASLKDNPQWQALKAVQSGNLFAFPVDFYSWDQTDPRWILGLSWLAATLQPDVFKDLNIRETVNGFYTQMYGLPQSVIDAQILPLLADDLP